MAIKFPVICEVKKKCCVFLSFLSPNLVLWATTIYYNVFIVGDGNLQPKLMVDLDKIRFYCYGFGYIPHDIGDSFIYYTVTICRT